MSLELLGVAALLGMMTMQQQPRVTIAAWGDSTTAGTPMFKSPIEAPPDGEGDASAPFPYWLMQSEPSWDVRNLGVNGERTDQIRARWERDVAPLKPAAVVILAGVNDVYQGRAIDHVTTQLRAMYDRAAAAGIPVIAGSIVPYNTATPEQNAKMRAINDWIQAEAARDANITFADTRAAAARDDNRDMLRSSPDGLHPDTDGYRRMASALRPAIRSARAAR
ncbi:MAG: GDSL-type esterase/lipase family protein [Acidobacteriota bacterium]|nr:GDSL-type esterase/lipase family protein [Acidobacteriota bacterium]